MASPFEQAWLLLKQNIDPRDQELNFYFRSGAPHINFEHGQRFVPQWQNKGMFDVLSDRVKKRVKPIGSMPVSGRESKWQEIQDKHSHTGQFNNKYGYTVGLFSNMGESTLQDLAAMRDIELPSSPRNLRKVKDIIDSWSGDVNDYAHRPHNDATEQPVNFLESALLYGFPLTAPAIDLIPNSEPWSEESKLREKNSYYYMGNQVPDWDFTFHDDYYDPHGHSYQGPAYRNLHDGEWQSQWKESMGFE